MSYLAEVSIFLLASCACLLLCYFVSTTKFYCQKSVRMMSISNFNSTDSIYKAIHKNKIKSLISLFLSLSQLFQMNVVGEVWSQNM